MERQPLYGGEPDGLYVANIPSVPWSKHEDHRDLVVMDWLLLPHASSASIPSLLHLQVRNALASQPLGSRKSQSLLQPLCPFTPANWEASRWLAGGVNA